MLISARRLPAVSFRKHRNKLHFYSSGICSQLKGPPSHRFIPAPFSSFHRDVTIGDRDINHWINYYGPPGGSRTGVLTLIKRQRARKGEEVLFPALPFLSEPRHQISKNDPDEERGNYFSMRGQGRTDEPKLETRGKKKCTEKGETCPKITQKNIFYTTNLCSHIRWNSLCLVCWIYRNKWLFLHKIWLICSFCSLRSLIIIRD